MNLYEVRSELPHRKLSAAAYGPPQKDPSSRLFAESHSAKKTRRSGRRWREPGGVVVVRARTKRGQARRSEAKEANEAALGYKSVVRSLTAGGRRSASIQGQPLRRSRPSLSLSSIRLFRPPLFLLFRLLLLLPLAAVLSFPSLLLKSAVSAICLNSESKWYPLYSPYRRIAN